MSNETTNRQMRGMSTRNKHLFVLVLFMLFNTLNKTFAQIKESPYNKNDSIISSEFNSPFPEEYRQIEEESKKHTFSSMLYFLFFRNSNKDGLRKEEVRTAEQYAPYANKIIRNINVIVAPPFGLSYIDKNYKSTLDKLDEMHIMTKPSIIKRIIQIKENEKLIPALVMSSEADLRSTSYIMDVRIMVDSNFVSNDSVDVSIYVRDKWTVGLNINSLGKNTDIEFFDDNLFGTGGHAGVSFIYSSHYHRKFGYGLNYSHDNIYKGIGAGASYVDYIYSYQTSASIYRPLQPKYKYFGEATVFKQHVREHPLRWDSLHADKSRDITIGLGQAFTLKEENHITQFVVGASFNNVKASYKKEGLPPSLEKMPKPYEFTDHSTFLMQATLYKNAFQQEYMIYNIGTFQDVAEGYNLSTQIGYSHSPIYKNAMYASIAYSYSTSNLVPGNLFLKAELGSFFKKGTPFGGVLRVGTNYFSPLFPLGNIYLRQFVDVSYSAVLNPMREVGNYIYLGQRISMLTKNWYEEAKGDKLFLVKSETDFYTKLYFLGFHFTFYNFLDFGWMTPGQDTFTGRHFAYGIGFGTRLRNNHIIFNTIDIKVGYYPQMKQTGFGEIFRISFKLPQATPTLIPELPRVILPN